MRLTLFDVSKLTYTLINTCNLSGIGFFIDSAVNILTPQGHVMVTLCKGQGGTPADRPQRAWPDSWQVVSMAANAGLILSEIHPFHPGDFPGYFCTGFRYGLYSI